jgi:UPF0716 protein FxsA
MAILILLAILCIPIAEIAVLIKAGQVIGVGWTLILIVLSGILGAALMRRQGLKVLAETQRKLDRGELPVGEMFDGLCVLMAGTLLLIPGFLTDVVGLLLFIPPVRLLLGTLLLSAIMRSRNSHIWVNGVEVGPGGRRGQNGGPVIDGDYTDVTGRGDAGGEPGKIGFRPDAPGASPWRRRG